MLAHVPHLILVLVLLAVTAAAILEMKRITDTAGERQSKAIEVSVRSASVQCYALEGSYPPNLDWLKQHYGLVIDETRYFVVYRAFASNLMPEIEVLEK